MWPFILGGIGYIVYKGLFASDEIKVTDASDCHENFLKFDDTISISNEKVANLKRAHNTIRDKLLNYFDHQPHIPPIQFFIQGSYKMKTMVENINKFSDVDLGIYFQEKPNLKINTLQWHIKQALIDHTTKGVEVKKMCIRLNYVRDFHIDMPIYYIDYNNSIYFGSKTNGWTKSDPKDFVKWFNRKTKGRPQMIRIIRYLKAWADYRKYETEKKFPSGLALTLWVIEHYEDHHRDDIAFTCTCEKILKYLNDHYQSEWTAKMPVAPFDNTLDRLNDYQKEYFYNDFNEMITNSIEAIGSSKYSRARNRWKDIFGYRFK